MCQDAKTCRHCGQETVIYVTEVGWKCVNCYEVHERVDNDQLDMFDTQETINFEEAGNAA